MTRLSKLLNMLLRFIAVWAVDALSLLATAALLPSISLAALKSGRARSGPSGVLRNDRPERWRAVVR